MKELRVTYTEEYREKNKKNNITVSCTRYEINSDKELLTFDSDGSIVKKFEHEEWLSVWTIY